MPPFAPIQTNLNGGELTPLLSGAVDLDKYRTGLATQENFINLTQGPITLRPGTRFIAPIKDSSSPGRLLPFNFSQTQALLLEFS
jgi:hypothetical protein